MGEITYVFKCILTTHVAHELKYNLVMIILVGHMFELKMIMKYKIMNENNYPKIKRHCESYY